MFFKSVGHKQRFITVMQEIDKIYDGKFDQEYGAACYILTSSLGLWLKTQDYVGHHGIDIPTMLKEVDLSGGASILARLAGNLFNSNQTHCDVVELMRLDESNFKIALAALQVRRSSLREDDLN